MKKRSPTYAGAAVVAAAHNKLSVSTHDYHGWGEGRGGGSEKRGATISPIFRNPSPPLSEVGERWEEKREEATSIFPPRTNGEEKELITRRSRIFKSLSSILPLNCGSLTSSPPPEFCHREEERRRVTNAPLPSWVFSSKTVRFDAFRGQSANSSPFLL